jgi:hypothetical protein
MRKSDKEENEEEGKYERRKIIREKNTKIKIKRDKTGNNIKIIKK